jgi:hypothetical protein
MKRHLIQCSCYLFDSASLSETYRTFSESPVAIQMFVFFSELSELLLMQVTRLHRYQKHLEHLVAIQMFFSEEIKTK